MYQLNPYSSSFTVKPAKIIYELPSYHAEEVSNQEDSSTNSGTSPVEDLKRKQLQLLDKLVAFQKSLTDFLGKKPAVNDHHAKVDKGINKEERSKNKNKQADVENPEFSPSTTIVNQRRQVNITTDQVSIFDYKQAKSQRNVFDLHCHESDKIWLGILAKLGRQRDVGILLNKDESDSYKKANVKVHFEAKEDISILLSGELVAQGHIAVWKLLGTLLDLYSSHDSIVSLIADDWLIKAKLLISKKILLDTLSRELCGFLGKSDFLAAQNSIMLPDIILSSLFPRNIRLNNNVELWLKRIDSCVSRL